MSLENKKGVFLDVDSSIVENNLRFTNDYEDEFNKIFGSSTDNVPSKLVKPTPGMCIKTKEIETDTKLFVNICCTDAIPPPKDITESDVSTIMENDESSFRIPMSIGEIRQDKDRKGQNAKACDIAINPKFFKKIQDSSVFRNFFFAVVFQGLENKYGIVCSDEKIILNNRKAFGTLQMHRIVQREIEEKMRDGSSQNTRLVSGVADENNLSKKPLIETISSESLIKEPEYVLYKEKGQHNRLIGEFKFPDMVSSNDLTLDIGEDRILIESKSRGYLLDIFIPLAIKQQSCTSKFDKSSRTLFVTMPLLGG